MFQLSLPYRRRRALIGMGAAALAYAAIASNSVDHLQWWLGSAGRSDQLSYANAALADYHWSGTPTLLAEIPDNLSGLAFDSDNNRLLAVVNNPEELLTLDLLGKVTGRYPLADFIDTEGIAYLGDNRVAVVEERSHHIYFIDLPPAPATLYKASFPALRLAIEEGDNDGFEGLGYDRTNDYLFIVKEHSPRRLYQVKGLRGSLNGQFGLEVLDRSDWLDNAGSLRDLSSIEIDPTTHHLLLLSDESQRVVELNGDGLAVSDLRLDQGSQEAARPEGIAIDPAGTLYLVSEPNHFYRLTKQ
jgi:uncharacterized protein YjiK